MANITLDGQPCHTSGELPAVGTKAPDFRLVTTDLLDVSLATYRGKTKVLNVVPSLNTGVCAASARTFNEKAATIPNAVVLVVSADLPFAMKNFCAAEGLRHVVPLSMMRGRKFAKDYGTLITDGPFEGISARAVIVIDGNDKVLYTQLVREIGDEPDYDGALAAVVSR
jgi:thiol peroxidase